MQLAPYACAPSTSRGRRYPEPPPQLRSEYQRDRDRIIHSAAFRRLEYKTQVFVNHEGDLYRTRLTHSLEVAQISRSIARALHLDEDLIEAIALAHDLGHTPFGHAGQDALNTCMRPYGGFEHNLQSLRVVDELEEKYAQFPGLNLSYEAREGILKHCPRSKAGALGALGERFVQRRQPSLEAQVANLADEIAYNSHDVDDGLRSGLIQIEQLGRIALFGNHYREVRAEWPDLNERRTVYEVVRRIINHQVLDLVHTSQRQLSAASPADVEAVRTQSHPLVGFSETMAEQNLGLKQFLRTHLYQHYRVHRRSIKAKRIVTQLFQTFIDDPRLTPPATQGKVEQFQAANGDAGRAQAVADYIAGMTDRYAIAEYQRVLDPVV